MVAESPPTTRSQRTRTELVRAVHDEVSRTGALDVPTIVKVAGVSSATFYAYFDTHDDALAGALDLSLGAVVGACERTFQVEALLERGVAPVVEDLVRETVAAFDVEALVMRAALARLPHHRPIRDVYRRHETSNREHLTRHITLGQRAGLIRDGDPAHRATSLLVLIQGLNNPLLLGNRATVAVSEDLCLSIVSLLAPSTVDIGDGGTTRV